MSSRLSALALVVSLLTCAMAVDAVAADQCRDAGGKFITCPPPAASPTKCRDIQTKKFAKCGTPGTEPVPAAAATSGKCRDIETKKFAKCGTPGTEPVPSAG
jgi:hypothetical protein